MLNDCCSYHNCRFIVVTSVSVAYEDDFSQSYGCLCIPFYLIVKLHWKHFLRLCGRTSVWFYHLLNSIIGTIINSKKKMKKKYLEV